MYEDLDLIAGHLDATYGLDGSGMVARILMAITGTEVQTSSVGPVFTWNPETQAAARAVALRWLRDRGHQRA